MTCCNDTNRRRLPPGHVQSRGAAAAVARALVATLVCLSAGGCQCQLIDTGAVHASVDRCQAGFVAMAAAAAGPRDLFGDEIRGVLSSSNCLPAAGSGRGANAADKGGTVAITDGIFWSDAVERLLPPPERSHRQRHWRQHASSQAVGAVRAHCGRLRGAYEVTFEDGHTRACARPQRNVEQLLGTVYTAALAGLLGLGNHVPASLLVSPPEQEPERWSAVADDIRGWRQGRPVAFVDLADARRLADAVLPESLTATFLTSGSLPAEQQQPSLTPLAVVRLSPAEAAVLAQWSDLVLFDYITAHTDRIVNGIVNARWGGGGAQIWRRPVHKMAADVVDGSLLYTDNEDAIFQGYSLLDAVADGGQQYAAYHEAILSRLCVFRASTVGAIERYHKSGDLADKLIKAVERHDSVAERFLPHVGGHMGPVLQARLASVASWVHNCSVAYSSHGNGQPRDGPRWA